MLDTNSLALALFVGLLGYLCSQMLQHYRKMKADKDVGQAVRSLRAKGYVVTLDLWGGFDSDTQTEMERVRSVGYTVLDKNGKPIAFKNK